MPKRNLGFASLFTFASNQVSDTRTAYSIKPWFPMTQEYIEWIHSNWNLCYLLRWFDEHQDYSCNSSDKQNNHVGKPSKFQTFASTNTWFIWNNTFFAVILSNTRNLLFNQCNTRIFWGALVQGVKREEEWRR